MSKILAEKIFVLLIFCVLFGGIPKVSFSQNYYWVAFTDKNNSQYSISNPEAYLSERAILRRGKQNIPIDSLDLPVNTAYIQQVLDKGVSLVHKSKWLNGITVRTDSIALNDSIRQLHFVKEVSLSKPDPLNKSLTDKFYIQQNTSDTLQIDTSYYGNSVLQIGQLNGQFLHNQDYRGEGIQIAVLDAGFFNVDTYSAFDSLWLENRVLGTKDFVDPESNIFETHYHGMSVLSCMAGNIPGSLIGTAPDASYWLLRSEDSGTEYIVEEDYWVAAAEFADSVGADIINSSLGYSEFDDESMDHSYEDMDGETTRVTRAANIAASRGMLVFSSAGNEGDDPWKYIVAPGDGDEVIAVGAVDAGGIPPGFSGYGPSFDGDVKPNISAIGRNTYLQRSNGELGFSNGTSFSTPVMAGMGACLWQAHSSATAEQIKQAIEQSATLYPDSNPQLGYGIPDMKTAYQILTVLLVEDQITNNEWKLFPNPVTDYLVLQKTGFVQPDDINISIYTIDGRLLFSEKKMVSNKLTVGNLQSLPDGLLILELVIGDNKETFKFSKLR